MLQSYILTVYNERPRAFYARALPTDWTHIYFIWGAKVLIKYTVVLGQVLCIRVGY